MRSVILASVLCLAATQATALPPVAPEPAAPAPAVPGSANPAFVATSPPPPPAQPITATLNDGSKVEIEVDGSVWVLAADGKSEAPDGTMTLKDGTPFVVKEGKWVTE